MGNPNPDRSGLIQWKPGQSGNPKGHPLGKPNLTTHIQNLMEDESFEAILHYDKDTKVEYKGAPIKAIIAVAMMRAVKGDERWAEWLAKHGWGSKLVIGTEDPVEAALRKLGLMEGENVRQDQGSTEKTP